MDIKTKFGIGDEVMVKPGDRPVHMPEDENNLGKVIRIDIEVLGSVTLVNYLLEFKDPQTGEVDEDWEELYEEDMLEEKA